MIVLDSSIWVAFILEDDSQHAKAVSLFPELNDEIIIPEYVMLEVCSVLIVQAGKHLADRFLEISQHNENSSCLCSNENFFNQVIEFFQAHKHTGLSFVDVSLLYLAKQYTVLTFDKQLEKAIAQRQ